MNSTGRFKRMLGAIALTASVATGGTALAQEAQPAPKPAPITITMEANTRPKNLANDLLFTNDYRTTVKNGKWSIAMENNRDNSFKGGDDFLAVGYNSTFKGWDWSPSLRFSDNSLEEIGLYAGKTFTLTPDQRADATATRRLFDGTRLNGLVVAAGDHFALAKTVIDDVNLGSVKADLGLCYKTFDWSKGLNSDNGGFTGFGGIQTASGTAGIWGGISVDKHKGVTATIDRNDFGAVAFAKRMNDGTGFAGAQAAFGSDGKRMGGTFSPDVGFFFAEDITGNTVPPYVGSAGSYLVNGGRFGAQIALMDMPGAEYIETQFGGKMKTFGNGTQLFFGAGPKVYLNGSTAGDSRMAGLLAIGDRASLSLEGAYIIPAKALGNGMSITLEGRAAPDMTGSVRFSYTR